MLGIRRKKAEHSHVLLFFHELSWYTLIHTTTYSQQWHAIAKNCVRIKHVTMGNVQNISFEAFQNIKMRFFNVF